VREARSAAVLINALPSLPAFVDTSEARVGAAVPARVRALLAKAESTDFPAEAEALVAKAHQLMARHTIDEAMLGDPGAIGDVVARRIPIDDPYARARFHLLSTVAHACACRALWWSGLGLAALFGLRADVEAAELLYTSLLLQATTGMAAAGSGPYSAPSTTAGFRRAYLLAFAFRIGERLNAAADASVVDLKRDHGDAVLPVLASRRAAVDAAFDAIAKGSRPISFTASNWSGWRAGADAAERATLTSQPRLPPMPRQLRAG
jgi:hypothetical protein